jgi:SAM-dependent methyltransferase
MPGKFPKRDYSGPPRRQARPAAGTAWEAQAAWYDAHQGDGGDDLYQSVLLPRVMERLDAGRGRTVLDVGCGQGVLGRTIARSGAAVLGVDASPALVAAATARAGRGERYLVGDVRELGKVLGGKTVDHAAMIMVAQDLDPLDPVLAGIAAAMPSSGRLVIALTHPCFRAPRRTGWGWDAEAGSQYRRIDGYLSPFSVRLRTHPGAPPGTPEAAQHTLSVHRPLSVYLNALGQAGFAVVRCDELCNPRRGTRGPRYLAEDRAAKEIPLFLVLTALRLAKPAAG